MVPAAAASASLRKQSWYGNMNTLHTGENNNNWVVPYYMAVAFPGKRNSIFSCLALGQKSDLI